MPVSLGTLSSFLAASVGVTGLTFGYGYRRLALRSFPSAGGLQGPEVYFAVQAVDGLESGVYQHQAMEHLLERIEVGTRANRLSAIALGQPYVSKAAFVVFLTGSYERLRWKYGERAYRYLCMDAGGATQNLYLAAEALGLGSCATAGFIDDAVEKLLDIDGVNELALLLLTVGSIAAPK